MIYLLIKLYVIQLLLVGAYMWVSTYVNNKKAFETKAQAKKWAIPFYLPFLRVKKGIKKMLAQNAINNE